MSTKKQRLTKLALEPRRIPEAVTRRLFPQSRRFGNAWVRLADGSVTFRERGFVAADGPAMLLARHNFELRTIAVELDGVHVAHSLEVGCGFGRLSQSIAAHSDVHTAIDINRDALDLASATYSGVDFKFGSAHEMPVSSGSIGLLVSWTVLQHIRPESIKATCTELLRVLAPGAAVLICEEIARPGGTGRHTWHRTVEDYERLLTPLTLVRHSPIVELEAVPGIASPGEVMMFRAPA